MALIAAADLSIIVATRPGRPGQAWRTREAYLRETPGDPQIIVITQPDRMTAWQIGIREAMAVHVDAGEVRPNDERSVIADLTMKGLVHFTTDELEPHPGWLDAAKSAIAAGRVPAPMIWSPAGNPETVGRDWSPALSSDYPTLSLDQLRQFGAPPLHDRGAEFAIRLDYAFTRWED